jgi:hypothetical protein
VGWTTVGGGERVGFSMGSTPGVGGGRKIIKSLPRIAGLREEGKTRLDNS